MVVVVEDNQLRFPRVRSQVEKSVRAVSISGPDASSSVLHRGLLIQLESHVQRRVWHVIYQQAPAASDADINADKSDDKSADKAEDDKDKESAAVTVVTDADKSAEKLEVSKRMCLRELDMHKCCIMAPVIRS